MTLDQILTEGGFDIVSGYDNLKMAIAECADNSTVPRCSGYGVFPDGTKCGGCGDCKEVKDNE